MNGDLISREVAVKLLTDKAYGYYVSMFATSDECHMARVVALEAANEIESLPAVDAAPVVHGELRSTGFDELYCEWGDCSECGADNRISAKFCNNCGARLDGKDGVK